MTVKKQPVTTNEESQAERAQKMLHAFGLSESESKIYVYLLERGGEVGGSKIAIGTKLHRQYVYLAIPKLMQLRLVEEVAHGKLHKYKAAPPHEIEKIAKKRVIEAEDIVKELQKFSKVGHEQDFEVIQGVQAIQKHEARLVAEASISWECYILGGGSVGYSRVMGELLEDHLRKMKQKKLPVKYIGSSNERPMYDQYIGKFENQEYRFMKHLPEGVTHLVVRQDTVSFYSFLSPPLVYIVKSPVIAENYKQFFMMLWDMAGEGK